MSANFTPDQKGYKPYQSFGTFRLFVLENFPFISEDFDALTYYQMLCKVVGFLQDVITNNESLQYNQTELLDAYNELQNYVNTYFENLDVQTEINNKLDQMAQDGTLQEIITNYLKLKTTIIFENVESMKNSNNLINGSFAKTLGYHNANDKGNALYKIIDTLPQNKIANNQDIIALNNNLYAELIIENNFINIKCFGANEDGITDDAPIINSCIDFARENKLFIQFNKKKEYAIKTTIDFDVQRDKFIGNHCTFKTNVTPVINFTNSFYPPFYNIYNCIDGIYFRNVNTNKIGTCFEFNQASTDNSVSHIEFTNLCIANYDIGVHIVNNAYLLFFNHTDIIENNIGVLLPTGMINAGENITIMNSTLSGNGVSVEVDSGVAELFLTNCSIDYNTNIATKTSSTGSIIATNCHFEGNQRYIGNGNFNNCTFLFLTVSNNESLFSTYNNSYMEFNNCEVKGSQAQSSIVDNNLGVIKFNNTNLYITQAVMNYRLNDLSLFTPSYLESILYNYTDNKFTNAYGNITFDNGIVINKTGVAGQNVTAFILIPMDANYCNINFDYEKTFTENPTISAGFCNGINEITKNIVDPNSVGSQSIVNNNGNISFSATYKRPNDKRFLYISVNCNACNSGNTKVSNFKIQTF